MFPLCCFSQTTQVNYKHDSIYNFLFTKDSTIIKITDRDSIVYSKSEFLFLEKNYSDLFDNKYALSPDELYQQINHKSEDTVFYHFASEVGKDDFYILYGYLLSARNRIGNYETQKKKLFNIYEIINSIHAKLLRGGTYFGHMSWRIYGYTEYGVYYDGNILKSKFDYSKQKELFIQSLKQSLSDEVDTDEDIINNDKAKYKKDLFELVNELDKEIDNYFYLSMARKFEYTYY